MILDIYTFSKIYLSLINNNITIFFSQNVQLTIISLRRKRVVINNNYHPRGKYVTKIITQLLTCTFASCKVSPREFVSSLLIEFSIIPISFNFNYAEFRLIRGLVLIRVLLALTWNGRRSRWQTC